MVTVSSYLHEDGKLRVAVGTSATTLRVPLPITGSPAKMLISVLFGKSRK